MKIRRNSRRGQSIVEYIIIVVVIAIAALAIMGIFSDRIRTLIAGAASSLGSENAASAVDKSSAEILKEMDKEGIDITQ